MKLIIFFVFILATACSPELQFTVADSAVVLQEKIYGVDGEIGDQGEVMLVYPDNIYIIKDSVYGDNISVSVNGKEVKAYPHESGQIFIVIPKGVKIGQLDIVVSDSKNSLNIANVFYLENNQIPLYIGQSSQVCSGLWFYTATGQLMQGTKDCSAPEDCRGDGEVGCTATSALKAFDGSQINAAHIKKGTTIAGVTGSFQPSSPTADCASDNDLGCMTTEDFPAVNKNNIAVGSFKSSMTIANETGSIFDCGVEGTNDCFINSDSTLKAADLSNLIPENIKDGATILTVSGQYPSSSHPLDSYNASVTSLDLASDYSQLNTADTFQYWDSAGNRHTIDGDVNLQSSNIKTGTTVLGVTGNYLGALMEVENFVATANKVGEVNLSWDPYQGVIEEYIIARSEGSEVSFKPTDSEPSSSYSIGVEYDGAKIIQKTPVTSYRDSFELQDETSYHYAIFARTSSNKYTKVSKTNITTIAADKFESLEGQYNPCALKKDGKGFCWGAGDNGILGIGNNDDKLIPTAVLGGVSFKKISGSIYNYMSCGLSTENEAYCWGTNTYYNLGNLTDDSKSIPDLVETHKFIDIASSYSGACAIKSDGSIYCWGSNTNAALGLGAANSDNGIYPNPVLLTEKAVFKSIEAGYNNYCALSHDDEVWCWGNNNYGQAGFDVSDTNILKPQKIAALSDVIQIELGAYHSCALKSNGKTYCWGLNSNGRLGDGTSANTHIPELVYGTDGANAFESITVGWDHSCGITSDAKVYCWGSNTYGQLGQDSSTASSNTPQELSFTGPDKTIYKQIKAYSRNTCGIKSTGEIECWGFGLRNGNATESANSHIPVAVDQDHIDP